MLIFTIFPRKYLVNSEEDEFEGNGEININIMPPITANEDLTDEDSGDEDIMSINNLPGSQLLAEAEINNFTSDDEDDNIPLKILQLAQKK
ncbi:hypothetical protein QE152_g1905 [Popillia japonica]|uniref:Uncharacterized protein n=1 Tax=Popillia japonica TaxID=7064 RepID=A0AAW1N520_POPJA